MSGDDAERQSFKDEQIAPASGRRLRIPGDHRPT